MITLLVVAVVAAALFLLATALVGWNWALLLMTLVAVAVLPRTIGLVVGDYPIGGYTVAGVGLAALALYAATRVSADLFFVPLVAFLVLGLFTFWEGTSAQWVGAVQLIVAVGTWLGGRFLGTYFDREARGGRWLAFLLAAIVAVELVVCALQGLGVDLFPNAGRTAQLEGDRANGTLEHPGDLGKVLVILLVLLMPLTRARDRVTRLTALVALFASLVPIGMTGSRSNFVAAVVAIAVWVLLLPGGRRVLALKAGGLAIVGVIGLIFAGPIIERFLRDPAGGERQHFMEVALAQIPNAPVVGVGPDSYIAVVGQTDAITRAGWRVHNILLLELVEIGILGTVLLFAPFVWLLVVALRRVREPGERGDVARAVLAVLPGFVIIGVTGWGLMYAWTLQLWFLAFGFAYSRLVAVPGAGVPPLPDRPGLRRVARLDGVLYRRARLDTTSR